MNYYEILGVKQNASQEEIKDVYKKLVKKYHPDIYKGDKHFAEKKIKEINVAYEVLSNEKTRKEYDIEINPPVTYDYTPPSYKSSEYSYDNYTKNHNYNNYDFSQEKYNYRYKNSNSNYNNSNYNNSNYNNSNNIINSIDNLSFKSKMISLAIFLIINLIILISCFIQISSILKKDITPNDKNKNPDITYINPHINNNLPNNSINNNSTIDNSINKNNIYISEDELRAIYEEYKPFFPDNYSFKDFVNDFYYYLENY